MTAPVAPVAEVAIARDYPLAGKTTLRLPGTAEYFCAVSTLPELTAALAFARQRALPVWVLGGGSNTVVRAKVPGLVIQVANCGIERVAQSDGAVEIDVAGGENWHELVMYCLDQGWYGLENLALIPGSVGAAPIQNIGAYGVELSAVLVAVEVVDVASGAVAWMDAAACCLAYRDSIFKNALKNRVVIWRIRLRLSTIPAVDLSYPELAGAVGEDCSSPAAVAAAVMALRRAKLPDPAQLPNAGSFFKNPVLSPSEARDLVALCPDIPRFPQPDGSVKFPAAWLIDRAGWKGVRQGAVGVHSRQALVLINHGAASVDDILMFSKGIAKDIKQKYNVNLAMEPVVLGESS